MLVADVRPKLFFLNASTIGTAQILLNSASEANPRGLCNRSDQVGRNIMDHVYGLNTAGIMPRYPADSYYRGRRPTGIYIVHLPLVMVGQGDRMTPAEHSLDMARRRAQQAQTARHFIGMGIFAIRPALLARAEG